MDVWEGIVLLPESKEIIHSVYGKGMCSLHRLLKAAKATRGEHPREGQGAGVCQGLEPHTLLVSIIFLSSPVPILSQRTAELGSVLSPAAAQFVQLFLSIDRQFAFIFSWG